MSQNKTEKTKSGKERREKKDRAAEIANTFEWLITAFILAFVFRAFVMEAFRIPTGSMADTLKGAHFRLRCRQCGYRYEHGFIPGRYRLAEDTIPRGSVRTPPTRCPVCGHYPVSSEQAPVANGDRILVLKCIYQFFEPKRWDVVVFKNPLEPEINYIKRLVGRPEEMVEIIDGDVYIDGQISRKPPKVQNELWMPVYDNDYQPVRPSEPSFNNHTWQQPFKNIGDSKWAVGRENPTLFGLDSDPNRPSTMIYDSSVGNDFRATYAYDDVRNYADMPYCSDLMVRFYLTTADRQGHIGVALSKYKTEYRASVDSTGKMTIARFSEGSETTVAEDWTRPAKAAKATLVKFANVDHRLIFEFGGKKLTYDLGRGVNAAGRIMGDEGDLLKDIPPEVKIFGAGRLTLSHVAIFRDIHYTEGRFAHSRNPGRAGQGNPFKLEKDEFFVLGDNSPNSQDSRWWDRPGKSNKNISPYPEGVVPRDYLVGKALFVYWPSGFKPFAGFPFGVVPNVGQMRFISGGSNKSP